MRIAIGVVTLPMSWISPARPRWITSSLVAPSRLASRAHHDATARECSAVSTSAPSSRVSMLSITMSASSTASRSAAPAAARGRPSTACTSWRARSNARTACGPAEARSVRATPSSVAPITSSGARTPAYRSHALSTQSPAACHSPRALAYAHRSTNRIATILAATVRSAGPSRSSAVFTIRGARACSTAASCRPSCRASRWRFILPPRTARERFRSPMPAAVR